MSSELEEQIYNLFLYVAGGAISEVGICVHNIAGTDEEKARYLRERVHLDLVNAVKFPLTPISYSQYVVKSRIGSHLEVFEPIFASMGASNTPFLVITPVVNGRPTFSVQSEGPIFELGALQETEHFPGTMPDYLDKYFGPKGFDMARLINDDFLESVKLLWNNHKYISAAKLLMSMVDSLAFIELGDVRDNFRSWLDRYANLSKVGVTSEELWEFRNSLLHMTNLHSRKVLKGQVPSLIMYVGTAVELVPKNTGQEKYFNLKALIDELNVALGRWLKTYVTTPEKIEQFVERYDLTISDSRMASYVVE